MPDLNPEIAGKDPLELMREIMGIKPGRVSKHNPLRTRNYADKRQKKVKKLTNRNKRGVKRQIRNSR